jgi:quercetin dioxygenase-like cupin family protein
VSVRLDQRIVVRERRDAGLRLEVRQAAGRGVPAHVHPAQEERIDVVDGEVELRLGRRRRRLAAGDSVLVPAGTTHGFRALGDRPARLVNELRPALRADDAFAHTFALERTRRTPLGRIVGLARVADAYPREFPTYAPLIPWRAQLAALRALARVAGRTGALESGDAAP